MRKEIYLFLLAIILLCHACFLDKKDKEVIVQVENEFHINMIEWLGEPRQLYFEMETVEEEPCNNSTISLSAVAKPDNILLQINGINSPTDCNPGPAPAQSTINVGGVAVGNYKLSIIVGNTVENQGIIRVSQEKYNIELFSTDGVRLTNETLFRIPESIVWGYAAYQDENTAAPLRDAFISELETLTTPHQLTNLGYYGQFTLQNNGTVSLKTPPQAPHHKAFVYQFTGSASDLKSLLDSHRNAANGAVSLKLFRGDGEVF